MIYKGKNLQGITLYIRSMRKALKVTAIFDNDDDANAHMAKPTNNDGVVALIDNDLIVLADVYDHGTKIGD